MSRKRALKPTPASSCHLQHASAPPAQTAGHDPHSITALTPLCPTLRLCPVCSARTHRPLPLHCLLLAELCTLATEDRYFWLLFFRLQDKAERRIMRGTAGFGAVFKRLAVTRTLPAHIYHPPLPSSSRTAHHRFHNLGVRDPGLEFRVYTHIRRPGPASAAASSGRAHVHEYHPHPPLSHTSSPGPPSAVKVGASAFVGMSFSSCAGASQKELFLVTGWRVVMKWKR